MTTIEPEFINIIEGPTPEFQVTPQEWVQSVHEGPETRLVATCQLRTGNGEDIVSRCQQAWKEMRPVKLEFPDELRMKQQIDVLALRLQQRVEGPMLTLWVSLPPEFGQDEIEFDDDEGDDLAF